MALNSSTRTAGDNALAAQYNDMRQDLLELAGEYAVAGGTGNAITLSVDAQVTALKTGQVFVFKASAANTGAVTINVNSLGAKALIADGGIALISGDIINGKIYFCVYDGTSMQVIGKLTIESKLRTLTAGTTSDADALHTHDELVATSAILTLQYNLSTATGTSVIAHGLSRTPYLVEVSAIYSGLIYSHGSSTGSSHKCIASPSSTYGSVPSVQTTSAIYIFTDVGNNNDRQVGTITFDSTNVTINWTKTASPTGNAQLVLTVFA